MRRLENKVAMVTGGASGIGSATAELFAGEGARTIIADVNETAGSELAASLRESGMDAAFVPLNVTSEASWTVALDEVLRLYGKLNVLVNNAGISLAKDVEDTTLDDWNRVMDVNSTGTFLGTKFGIHYIKQNGEPGSIINRSSIDGQIGESGLFAYCASKGAVTVLTKAAALSCGEKGYKIRVNSVHPGYVHTPLVDEEARGYGLTTEKYLESLNAKHPIGFIGQPIDVANVDLFLASDESRWITGSEFVVDGGFTAQ